MAEDTTHSAGQGSCCSSSPSSAIVGVTYGPRELMALLGVSENVIYRELQFGILRPIAFRVGRQWRVGANALERLMAGRIG